MQLLLLLLLLLQPACFMPLAEESRTRKIPTFHPMPSARLLGAQKLDLSHRHLTSQTVILLSRTAAALYLDGKLGPAPPF